MSIQKPIRFEDELMEVIERDRKEYNRSFSAQVKEILKQHYFNHHYIICANCHEKIQINDNDILHKKKTL